MDDEHDPVVYGKSDTPRVVAVEDDGDRAVRYRRDPGTDDVTAETAPFFPMMWLESPQMVADMKRDLRADYVDTPADLAGREDAWTHTRLAGDLPRNHFLLFSDMNLFFTVYGDLKQRANGDSYLADGAYVQTDSAQMYMMQSGETHFSGMRFEDIRRMQFDIEVYNEGGKKPEPERMADRVLIIAVSDNRGTEKVLHLSGGGEWVPSYVSDDPLGWIAANRTRVPFETEKDLMRAFVALVRSTDPDVLEGHNVHDFDLDYLRRRCDRLGVEFGIGRDGSVPRHYGGMKRAANRYIDYEVHDVYGRHVLDTMFQAYDWNVYARELDSFGLKQVAKTLGLAAPDRTYVDRSRMDRAWDENYDAVLEYALDDVRETKAVAEELSAALFEKAKIVPIGYGELNRCGTGREIESLMVREYLRQEHSLPTPNRKRSYEGAYTECFRQGVFGVREGVRINNYDFSSLYPYCQMGGECYPDDDRLNVMPRQLETLTNLRIEHKTRMRSLPEGDPEKSVLDAQQDAEKVLINSYYGTLGDEHFIFNDMDQAARITDIGRQSLKRLHKIIDDQGHTIIESDTDGVWALNDGDGLAGADLAEYATDALPDFLDVDLDADLDGMAMYRAKNYAKQTDDGSVSFKGSAMTSSMFEKFGREFIQDGFRLMLDGRLQDLHDLYVEYVERICDRDIPVEKLCKRETLREKYEDYREAVDDPDHGRTPDARYELAREYDYISESVGSQVVYYNAGDITSAPVYEVAKPVEEYDGDENVRYYVRKRMRAFARKFKPFFSEGDFERMFPRPDRGEVRVGRGDVSDVSLVRRQVSEPEKLDSLNV